MPLKVENKGKIDDYVYDISLDGSVVNALGRNNFCNTDGFNLQMPSDDKFRYTDAHPYIGLGLGRNTVKGKEYTKVEADVAEFEDMFMNSAYNGGINKMGLGIDEYCPATINFSRKNYADRLENGKTKLVGNTIKSRRMSSYIEKFLDSGVNLLLNGDGHSFLENYYAYIDKIFNYQIPLRDIASKGKIKKSVEDYIKDCSTLTKSGSKKSRQAWYELVINAKMKVDLNDTIYYVNVGKKKSESDVKRVTHVFVRVDGEEMELNKESKKLIFEKEYGKGYKLKDIGKENVDKTLEKYTVRTEDEILLNCKMVPSEIVDAEEDIMCTDEIEYNVEKYIEQFNNRIKPLLVCFSLDIRDKIMIKDPNERPYFTEEQCRLTSGFPYKAEDQDTYEQLMTPERKEMDFWDSVHEVPPFVKECGIDWDRMMEEYHETKRKEQDELFQEENEKYLKAINSLTMEDIEKFEEEGKLPSKISDIVKLDSDLKFRFLKIPSMTPSTGGYIFSDLIIPDLSEEKYEIMEEAATVSSAL